MSFVLLAALLAPVVGAAQAVDPHRIVRGVTVSTHTDGRDWGRETIGPTFDQIKALGANWVAIHPYARIGQDGSVRSRDLDRDDEPPLHLRRPIAEAHRRGLKILIKPHLAYWGSPFSWRGEIDFGDDHQAWARFWREYRAWIVELARLCSDADGLAVGTELDRTLGFEAEWRQLVAEVREVIDVPLTYAANWTDYRQVGFWDALDAIGIQAYFPLTTVDRPTLSQLSLAWEGRMAELRGFAEEQDRNILFTELGYSRSFSAAREPWSYASDGVEAEPLQLLCMRAALEAVAAEPRVVGVFLWKWFPLPRPVGRNFELATPEMTRLLAEIWGR